MLDDGDHSEMLAAQACVWLGHLIDSYIHTFNSFDFDEEKATTLYVQVEAPLFAQSLEVGLIIPILLVECDFDTVHLSDRAAIAKLTEKQQLSRMASDTWDYDASVPQRIVAGAATHALVLAGYQIKGPATYRDLLNVLTSPQAFPVVIDEFFCSLRMASVDTGYSQIITAPIGWAAKLRGNLHSWMSAFVRRYPARFDNWHWTRSDISRLSQQGAADVGKMFQALRRANRKEDGIAIARINRAAIREEEEDAVIDATIALEALLSDSSTQEMTHKLALRVAALSRLVGFVKEPAEVFREVKSIYSYRSTIVHGSAKKKNGREIALGTAIKLEPVVAAEEYARMVLKALLLHPEFRDPRRIDTELLLAAKTDTFES